MNSWNTHSCNSRLNILEKTEAHRKHLLKLVTTKSSLNTHQSARSRSHCSTSDLSKRAVLKQNQQFVQRIVRASKGVTHFQSHSNLNGVSRNLKVYSSLGRSLKMKEIEKENQKLFTRLVTTNPTIRRKQWAKTNQQTNKYRQNLLRNRYHQPDYSEAACRLLQSKPKFRLLNPFGPNHKKLYTVGQAP